MSGRHPNDWSEADEDTLRRLAAEGLPTAEIGRRMCRSTNAVIGKMHRLKLPKRPNPVRKPEPRGAILHLDRIRELAVHNSRPQIARLLGLTVPAVEHACSKHGIPPCGQMQQRSASASKLQHLERETRSSDIVRLFDRPDQEERVRHARVSRDAARAALPVPGASLAHPRGCQWHLGREGLTHLFCGAPIGPKGGSWCASHRDIVYVPMSTRRIADAA